tara:strand:+ start:1563 stop:1733 length:171 start_codon:yes stop_codon:yes gene_type:complete
MERSVYDISKAQRSHGAFKRRRENLDTVFGEVEAEIRRQWPSVTPEAVFQFGGEKG